jgi:hypothetical protein
MHRAVLRNLPVSITGLLFVYISAFAFYFIGERLTDDNIVRAADLRGYIPELILCGIAVFSALLGVRLVRVAGLTAAAPNPVINPQEWAMLCDQVKGGKEEAVTQYIRLTSLTGFTGVFTKLGLQGLPLATIGLTMFFSILYFQDDAFLDLAKLTLGAFIGSFVQKQVTASQAPKTLTLPSGEKVRLPTGPDTVV